ncbi:MAG: transposase [Planctomycetia bacterium]|nr:MAG: transposase [Planctomycetia bacterium]
MKDGTTHIAHKAEHAVDTESELLLAATVQPGDRSDPESLTQTLVAAQLNLMRAGSKSELRDLATDSGYHKNETLAQCAAWGIRTYISEKDESQSRVWGDKPAEQERAFRNNRRRIHGRRGDDSSGSGVCSANAASRTPARPAAGGEAGCGVGERGEALRDSRGGVQPGRDSAEVVRGRHAAEPAGPGRRGLRARCWPSQRVCGAGWSSASRRFTVGTGDPRSTCPTRASWRPHSETPVVQRAAKVRLPRPNRTMKVRFPRAKRTTRSCDAALIHLSK